MPYDLIATLFPAHRMPTGSDARLRGSEWQPHASLSNRRHACLPHHHTHNSTQLPQPTQTLRILSPEEAKKREAKQWTSIDCSAVGLHSLAPSLFRMQ